MSNYQWDSQVYMTNLLIETIPKEHRTEQVLKSLGLMGHGDYGLLQLALTRPIRDKIGGLDEPERTQWKSAFSASLVEGLEGEGLEVLGVLNLQSMIRTIVFKFTEEASSQDRGQYLQHKFLGLSSLLRDRYAFEVTGCFGPCFEDFFDIGNAYRTACKLLTYHYCIGVGQCAFTLGFHMDEGPSLVEYKYLHHFEKLLEDDDWGGIHQLITTIANTLKAHPVKDSKTSYICKEIFSMTIRYFFKEAGSHQEEIQRLNEGITMFDDWFDDIDQVVLHYLNIISVASMDNAYDTLHPHVRKALAIIHRRYNEPITLEGIADDLGLSMAYLSRLFKGEMSVTFKVYLTGYRIDLAKRLLRESHKKIEDIRVEVGYQSQSQFARAFKKNEGIPPSSYRQLYRQ